MASPIATIRGTRMSLQRWIRRLANVDRYEFSGGIVLRHRGWFRQDSIELAQISSWSVAHEMCFDIVVLSLKDTSRLVWFDYDKDLLSIVRQNLPALESDSE